MQDESEAPTYDQLLAENEQLEESNLRLRIAILKLVDVSTKAIYQANQFYGSNDRPST